MRERKFEILFSLLLAAFTVYALLDAFVIPRRYETVERVPETVAEELKEIRSSATQAQPSVTQDATQVQPSAPQDATQVQPSAPQDATQAQPSVTEGVTDGAAATTRRRKRGKSGAGGGSTRTPESASANDAATRSWSNENISVSITQYREYDTDVYVADITLSAPEFLKTAFAGDAYGRNIKAKTSAIAAENNAVLAINGDYYGARERGYVIRNGVLYRDIPAGGDALAIMRDGSFQIADDRQVTARELLDAGAVQAFSFGPALIKDGTVTVSEGEEVGKAMASNPRTAIAVLGQLHYAFVVADGRTDQSEGMSLHELAEFIQRLGAEDAYNLDGGGSSTMVFQGEIVNRPTTSGNALKERSVSDIVCLIP